MIKEALEFLSKLQTPLRPITVDIDGQPFKVNSDATIGEAVRKIDPRFPRPTLKVSTLSGLVTSVKASIDKLGDRVALVIVDPFNVSLMDLDADEYNKRHQYVSAVHVEEKPFKFNTYMDPEDFLLAFRASFLFTEDAVKVQQLCSTVCAGTGVAVSDDGISQEVTTKSGTITKASVQLPADGVPLVAVRTFRDANPTEAKYLLRMKGVKDALPQMALFEIDPMWKIYTVASIRKYLEDQLPGATIIA